jgi:hypothetical protein
VDGTRLFHVSSKVLPWIYIITVSVSLIVKVRGYAADDMRAVQVAETASSLNSDDVFVLETPSKTYLWNGVVSPGLLLNCGA